MPRLIFLSVPLLKLLCMLSLPSLGRLHPGAASVCLAELLFDASSAQFRVGEPASPRVTVLLDEVTPLAANLREPEVLQVLHGDPEVMGRACAGLRGLIFDSKALA